MSRKDQAVYFISVTVNENEIGDYVETQTKRPAFAEKKSIKQSEFYQAQSTGLRPEIAFVVWTREYNQDPKLEYNGKIYDIIRTYEPNSEDTELTCQGLVNGVM